MKANFVAQLNMCNMRMLLSRALMRGHTWHVAVA